MRQFAAFCHEENIHPLQATTHSVVRYTAWLGLQGTVAAASLQEYYSAINKFFRDHKLQPIAVGELLADARRGLEMQQQRLQASDSRLPLPATLPLSLLTAAAKLRTHLQWTLTSRHLKASATGSLHKLCVFLESRIMRTVFNTRPRRRPAIQPNLAVYPKG
jgi:hypothetical protein